MVPLKSKDGLTTFITPDEIMKRWTEHFTDLFSNPAVVDNAAIDSIPQRDCIYSLDEEPSLDETINSIKQINTGKAPGLEGIPVEFLRHGGENLNRTVHSVILDIWRGSPVPQDWVDAILITLHKGKVSKGKCGDYSGISLFEAVGKVF